MPQPTKIPRPFADSGDKNTIPESSGALGFASWQEGFPAITGTPFAQGGVAPKRADFNGIFNALSAASVWQQQGGFYTYDATTDYEIGNVVEYSGDLYKCLVANGPSSAVKDPALATYWARLYTSAGGTVTGQFVVDGYHNSISNCGMLLTGTNQNYGFALQDTGITKGSTFPLSTKYISQIFFGSAMGTYYDRMAHIREAIDSNGANRLEMVAFGLQSASDNTTCSISVNVDENDVPYTSAPTPTAGDSSTQIATTAFVQGELTDVERVSAYDADSYIRYASGLQICWGTGTASSSGTAMTFPVAFSAVPEIVFAARPTSAISNTYTFLTSPRSATGATVYCNKDNAHATGTYAYIAVGRWK